MKFCELFIFIGLISLTYAKYHNNVFSEELVIKELNDDFVNTYFQFTTQWNFKTNESDCKFFEFMFKLVLI